MTKDNFNAIMWAGFVQWAYSEPEIRAAFRESTGLMLPPPAPTIPIEAMIDQATGVSSGENIPAFVEWVTRQHWGIDEAPQSYRDALEELRCRSSTHGE